MQHFYVTVYIGMEELKYLLSLYDQGYNSAVALDSALLFLNSPTKELTYLLQLYDQKHISCTALDYVLCVLAWEILKYLLQLHEHDRLGDEALDSSLRDLRPPMNVEETSPKQEEEIKEEPTMNWCMPGMTSPEPTSDDPHHIINIAFLE